MQTNFKKLLALGLFVSGTATVVASQAAYADEVPEETVVDSDEAVVGSDTEGHPHHHHNSLFFDGRVERSVEDIENGVIITLTTEDSTVLTQLQAKASEEPMEAPFSDEVTREITLLDNGIQISLTSEDTSVVEKLHNMPDKPEHPRFEDLNIDRTVENTENGVVITLTSDDPDVIEMLQDRADDDFFIGKEFRDEDHDFFKD